MELHGIKSHFERVQNFVADFCKKEFTLYESLRTGMRVAVVDQRGPKVSGYFALATEIHDDSGKFAVVRAWHVPPSCILTS